LWVSTFCELFVSNKWTCLKRQLREIMKYFYFFILLSEICNLICEILVVFSENAIFFTRTAYFSLSSWEAITVQLLVKLYIRQTKYY
jgi:hypothetical protein